MANNEFNSGASILVQQGGIDTIDSTSIIGFQQEISYIQGKGHILPSGLYDGQVKTIIKKDNPITFPLATGLFITPTTNVQGILQDVFGDYYVCGTFTTATLGNLANANYVAMYRPSTNVWTALGTGMNNTALKLIESPSKATLYCVGLFSLAGGVANTGGIAKWNRTLLLWEAVGTGCNGEVDDIVFQSETTFYLTGFFTLAGGVANTVRIAYWNGANYVALTTGLSTNAGYSLKFAPNLDTLYVVGTFAQAGGVANTGGVAVWTHSTSTWTALGGAGTTTVGTIYDCNIDTTLNRLYIVGTFSSINADTSLNFTAYFDLTANTWNRWGQGFSSGTPRRLVKVGTNWLLTVGSGASRLIPSSTPVSISVFYQNIIGIAVWNSVADIWVPYTAFNGTGAISIPLSVSTDGLQILTGGTSFSYMTVFNINSLSYITGSFIVPQITYNNLLGSTTYFNNKYKAINLHMQGNFVRLRWSSVLSTWILENPLAFGQLCYEIPSTTNT